VRWNVVSDIDNVDVRIARQDHAFHRSHEIIRRAEISKQSDDA
jgi:hypothetical protein